MKIGVLTFHFAYNYGAMLQAYALSRFLNEQQNVICEIVDYRPRKIDYLYHPDIVAFCKHPTTILRNYINKKISGADSTEFESFINEKFILSHTVRKDEDFKNIVRCYDMLFVGSDQVWNPLITGYDRNYLFQGISNAVKKFSYAASLGLNDLDENWKGELKQSLSEFEKISVREEKGYQLIQSILPEKEIRIIPDPVFLLNSQEWRAIAKVVNIQEKYILFYSLNGSDDLRIEAEKLAKREGAKIISVHPLFKPKIGEGKCDIGPESFLGLIDGAEYICTDSFHATAFSIILGKRLVVRYDKEKGNRILNLLKMLKVSIDGVADMIGRYNFGIGCRELVTLSRTGKEYIEQCLNFDSL